MDPTDAIKSGKFHKIPLMTGITSNEGTVTLSRYPKMFFELKEFVAWGRQFRLRQDSLTDVTSEEFKLLTVKFCLIQEFDFIFVFF